MTWHTHTIPNERGPLAVWYSCGNAEIVPTCVERTDRIVVQYELVVAGKARDLYPSLKKAKAAFVEAT